MYLVFTCPEEKENVQIRVFILISHKNSACAIAQYFYRYYLWSCYVHLTCVFFSDNVSQNNCICYKLLFTVAITYLLLDALLGRFEVILYFTFFKEVTILLVCFGRNILATLDQ